MPDSGITKKALAQTMKELMKKRPFAKISVGDICEGCDMNRKSFYYHFKDKHDLVNWIFYTEFFEKINRSKDSDEWELLERVCEYFYQNREFYVNALGIYGQNSFRDYFKSLLMALATEHLSSLFSDSKHCKFFTRFFSDALLMAIERWLVETPQMPPSEFVGLLKSAITGAATLFTQNAH